MSVKCPVARIHTLPPVLASQIAAGEVIERPASVVKELLENSLDAGARHIHIDIEAAGMRLIRVRDDGGGIHPDDLALALAPQSTSKIRYTEDLLAIRSFGFRGEALASIAAVARLRLTSRQADAHACTVDSEPGRPPSPVRPAAHPYGTTVEVRDLFFNIPARRKFLRSEQTELLHILDQVRALSLSQPDLGLKLRHNGRLVFSAGVRLSLPERIRRLFGREFMAQAWRVRQQRNGIEVSGVTGGPATARSQADRQYLFLNGRPIRDRSLSHALRLAFAEELPPGRFVPYALYLHMDPAAYDVNVHPAKHEVRFRAAREVHDFLYSALRDALARREPFAEALCPVTQQGQERAAASQVAEPAASGYAAPPAPDAAAATGLGEPLGRRPPGYLLAATADSVYIVDCRRAVRALVAAELAQALAAGECGERPLLIPERVPADTAAIAILERRQDALAALGVRLVAGGPAHAVLSALPVQLPAIEAGALPALLLDSLRQCPAGADTAACSRELIEVLAEEAGRQYERVMQRLDDAGLLARLQKARDRDRLPSPWPWRVLTRADLARLFDIGSPDASPRRR